MSLLMLKKEKRASIHLRKGVATATSLDRYLANLVGMVSTDRKQQFLAKLGKWRL